LNFFEGHRLGDGGTGATLGAYVGGSINPDGTSSGTLLGALVVPRNDQWTPHAYSFVATSSQELLTFVARNAVGGPVDQTISLDGVSVLVPEPCSLLLCGLGAVGLIVVARRRCKS
jgi:hypothetical protein